MEELCATSSDALEYTIMVDDASLDLQYVAFGFTIDHLPLILLVPPTY